MRHANFFENVPPGVDLSYMEALLELEDSGSPGLMRDLLELFLKSTPLSIQAIEKAAASKDFSTLNFEAHALKSSAANLGLEAIRTPSLQIETAATANDIAGVSEGLWQLQKASQDLQPFLQNLFKKFQTG